MTATPTAVYSAPGKALLAGGYLVLFPEYSALSVGLRSRMHAAVFPNLTDESESGTLVISSPQFDSQWTYPAASGTHPNPFINACYDVVTAYYGQEPPVGNIVLWSDAGFHSQAMATKNHFAGGLKAFSYHGKPITKVAKTGLGSSAALVVVVVAAMVKLIKPDSETDLKLLHNLAQIAHIVAQQKVGSGFDVATAVFGSIIYSRFLPSEIPPEDDTKALVTAVNKPWDMTAIPCVLPPNLQIIMGDVAQGSETPGMVKKVLQWRSENQEQAHTLFTNLNGANMALASALKEHASSVQIASAISNIRKYLQELTHLSGVPVEPESQTKLLDVASQINGVLGGVVPGAGGEDALCLIVDTAQTSIIEVLQSLGQIKGVSWMHLPTEEIGLRSEPVQAYAYDI